MQLLLNNGADVNLDTKEDGKPLRIARQKVYETIAQILLDNKTSEN